MILFSAMKGNTQLTVSKVEITSTNHCTVNGSNSNTATITSILKNGDVYYDNGDFVCSVRYNDGGTYKTVTGIKIKFYANLLGTWKETVDAGTRTIAADQIVHDVDGGVLKGTTTFNYTSVYNAAMAYDQWTKQADTVTGSYKYINKHLSDAEGNISQLQSDVGNANSGLIKNVNTLTQRADQTTSEITQIKMGKNMLKGALSGSGFRCENVMPYPVHPPVPPTVDTDGWMEAPSGNTYICAPDITITRGKWYVLSFYSKYTSSIIVTTWSSGSTPDKQLSISAGSQSTRHYAAFKYDGTGSVTITICFPVTTLRYPQLELGEASDSTPTAFEVDSATETSSRISQSANEIKAEVIDDLNTTGIYITSGEITLKAGKVHFKNSTGSSDNDYFTLDADGKMYAQKGGSIGGFNIDEKALGSLMTLDSKGYLYLERNGHIKAYRTDSEYVLETYGNVALVPNGANNTVAIGQQGGQGKVILGGNVYLKLGSSTTLYQLSIDNGYVKATSV